MYGTEIITENHIGCQSAIFSWVKPKIGRVLLMGVFLLHKMAVQIGLLFEIVRMMLPSRVLQHSQTPAMTSFPVFLNVYIIVWLWT